MKKIFFLLIVSTLFCGFSKEKVDSLKTSNAGAITFSDIEDLKKILEFNRNFLTKVVESDENITEFNFNNKEKIASLLGLTSGEYEKQIKIVNEAASNFLRLNKENIKKEYGDSQCSDCLNNISDKIIGAKNILLNLRDNKVRFKELLKISSLDNISLENQGGVTTVTPCCGCSGWYYVCLGLCALGAPEIYPLCGLYCFHSECGFSCCIQQ